MVLGSFKGFQSDDYGMVVVFCFYTVLIVAINIVRDSSSNLLPPGFDVTTLTTEDMSRREFGSKLILVVEQCQCVTVCMTKSRACGSMLTARFEGLGSKVLPADSLLATDDSPMGEPSH